MSDRGTQFSMGEHAGVTEPPPSEASAAPVPRLAGNQAAPKEKKQEWWSALLLTLVFLFGCGVFLLTLPFLFFTVIYGPQPRALTPINIALVTACPPLGALILAGAVYGFVRRHKRLKAGAGE